MRLDAFFLVNAKTVLNLALPQLKLLPFASYSTFQKFPLFTVGSSRENCPSARCASATDTVCKDTDIFSKHLVIFNHILKQQYFWCQEPLRIVLFCLG
jgi:hypothetical protein